MAAPFVWPWTLCPTNAMTAAGSFGVFSVKRRLVSNAAAWHFLLLSAQDVDSANSILSIDDCSLANRVSPAFRRMVTLSNLLRYFVISCTAMNPIDSKATFDGHSNAKMPIFRTVRFN